MKNLVYIALMALGLLVSCTSKPSQSVKEACVYTVDSLHQEIEHLVGDTVLVENVCAHICQHGGRKAFLVGSSNEQVLRVEGGEMGKFDASCINALIRVRGIVCVEEQSIVPAVESLERHGEDGEGCETEEMAIKDYYLRALSYEIVTP